MLTNCAMSPVWHAFYWSTCRAALVSGEIVAAYEASGFPGREKRVAGRQAGHSGNVARQLVHASRSQDAAPERRAAIETGFQDLDIHSNFSANSKRRGRASQARCTGAGPPYAMSYSHYGSRMSGACWLAPADACWRKARCNRLSKVA